MALQIQIFNLPPNSWVDILIISIQIKKYKLPITFMHSGHSHGPPSSGGAHTHHAGCSHGNG